MFLSIYQNTNYDNKNIVIVDTIVVYIVSPESPIKFTLTTLPDKNQLLLEPVSLKLYKRRGQHIL
jgi:hypothetical protein